MTRQDEEYDRQRQALYLVSLLPDDHDEAHACLRLMAVLLQTVTEDRQRDDD